MELFWKSVAAILIAVILGLTLGKWEHHFTILLSVAVCCMVSAVAVSFLNPVLDLIHELESISYIGTNTISILMKVLAVSFISEIVGVICSDSGNNTLSKIISILSTSVILWLSIPVITDFLDILKQIVGKV